EHSGRALRSAITRVAAKCRERNCPARAERSGGFIDELSDLPVAGVISQREWATVCVAPSTSCAHDDVFGSTQCRRAPPHPNVLRQAEKIPARLVAKLLGGQRQASGR